MQTVAGSVELDVNVAVGDAHGPVQAMVAAKLPPPEPFEVKTKVKHPPVFHSDATIASP
jgi:hypothetical protein